MVFHVDPIKALFWSAVANGIAAVPLLLAVTLAANWPPTTTGRFVNSVVANVRAWLTIALMGAAVIALFVMSL